jgi:hypothetical protein
MVLLDLRLPRGRFGSRHAISSGADGHLSHFASYPGVELERMSRGAFDLVKKLEKCKAGA